MLRTSFAKEPKTHRIFRRLEMPWNLVAACIILIPVLIIAIFPGWFTHQNPTDFNYDAILSSPSAAHIFGTDSFGRDIFTRVLYATHLDLEIGVFCVLFPFIFGSTMGVLAGYFGGWFDSLIMRILDIVVAFPFFVLILAIMAILGPGMINMFIAVSIVGWVSYARLTRSEVLVSKKMEYVQAAQILGYSKPRILFKHVLPNVITPAIVFVVSDIVLCILLGSSLSFLGLGVQPPTPEWGAMISDGQSFLSQAWWISTFPGLAILLVGIGFSLLGDSLVDLFRLN
jgi:peptide/nickel transport system permease protein